MADGYGLNPQANLDLIKYIRQNPDALNLKQIPHSQILSMQDGSSKQPFVTIDEQPKQRGLRFRYKCEGRSAGSIPGENSTSDRKSYPSIKIHNFDGPAAIVVVSCVTKDKPYYPHPHNLVGQDCRDGVCTVKVKNPNSVITFPNIGIQCCKRHDVEENLKTREKIRVDPYSTGYPSSNVNIDLNAVRLCFQVFLPDVNKKFTRIVPPIISQPIIDKKSVHDLVICRLSRQSGYASGGDEVFLLCEKINKDDIEVRFYEESEDGIGWESKGDFSPNDVHRQYAIVFKTPAYKNPNIQDPITVFVQLRRPSDEEFGDPKPFQYIPQDLDPYGINMKRKKKDLNNLFGESSSSSSTPSTVQIPKTVMDESSRDDQDEQYLVVANNDHQTPYGRMNIRSKLKKKAEEGLQKRDKAQIPDIKFDPSTFSINLPKYSLIPSSTTATAATTTTNNGDHSTNIQSFSPHQIIQLLQKQSIGGNFQNLVFLKNIGSLQASDVHMVATSSGQYLPQSSTNNGAAVSSSDNSLRNSNHHNNNHSNIIVASSTEAVDQLSSSDLYLHHCLDNNVLNSNDSIPNLSGLSELMGGPDSTVSRDFEVGAQEMVVEETVIHPKMEHQDQSNNNH